MDQFPHDEQDDRTDEERTAHEREQLLTTTTATLVRKREQLAAAEQCLEQTQAALAKVTAERDEANARATHADAELTAILATLRASESARADARERADRAERAREHEKHELCVTRETLRLTATQRDYFDSKAAKSGTELDTARETLRELTALAEQSRRGATQLERELALTNLVTLLVRPRAAVEDVALEAAKRGAA